MNKKKDIRQNRIRQILLEEGRVRVKDLAERLDVTPETLRLDLNDLEAKNLVHRQHGFAIGGALGSELPVDVRGQEYTDDKKRIAYRAMQEIQDGQVVFLDSGSTIILGLPVLAFKKDITIVTNCIPLAYQATLMNLNVVMAGGPVSNVGQRTYGHFTTDVIDHISFDVAIMGTDGLRNATGFSTMSIDEVPIKRHIITQSQKLITVADRSKFERKASYSYCKFREFDMLVVNELDEKYRNIVKEIPKIIEV